MDLSTTSQKVLERQGIHLFESYAEAAFLLYMNGLFCRDDVSQIIEESLKEIDAIDFGLNLERKQKRLNEITKIKTRLEEFPCSHSKPQSSSC